jgi:RNA polymerase sigma factor (sigma-70 family)
LVQGDAVTAGRKRAAVELIAREDAELRRTARRYSLCPEDAEDAYQRALEILLLKAPNERPRDLIRWTKTVVKHEALAVRRNRERLLGSAAANRDRTDDDPIARIAAAGDGPGERLERHEEVARSREALRTLKPAELRSLTLLAAGYSYAEIGEITGYSRTKVNRTLAEGRERFRRFLTLSEDGSRCAELAPLLSAYCDGEAGAEDRAVVREHLRACVACRATMRAYRATPAAIAALSPALPLPRTLLERAQELLVGLQSRLPGAGGGGDPGFAQVATAGGTRGAGMAALAKALAICAGAVGSAACVATGVVPAPLGVEPKHETQARIERVSARALEGASTSTADYEPAPPATEPPSSPQPAKQPQDPSQSPQPKPEVEAEAVEAGAVEYVAPPPQPTPATTPEATPTGTGNAAGEFGP